METVSPGKSPHIRISTNEDVQVIQRWLELQDARDVPDSFLCNWKLTLAQHHDGELLVYIDDSNGEAIAYQWGGLVRPGILEVRTDRRGRGIGQAMVAHRLAEAFERNDDLLFIQCKPSSSIPFWRRMGFELVEGEAGKTYGRRTIHRTLDLPDDAVGVDVTVQWYPEKRKWKPQTPALATFSPVAVRTRDGEVHLAERVHWFDSLPDQENAGDVILRVIVEGKEQYCDKAKYDGATDIGLQRCRNGFFLDAVLPAP